MSNAQAPAIIYKTLADYYYNVPVTLNADKDKIVAYPNPSDLYYEGELSLPSKLKDGFYLDNRGVNANTAFTSFTYEEYVKLESPPPLETLFESIIDKDPFVAIWDAGNRDSFEDLEKELNKLIRSDFKDCKSLK